MTDSARTLTAERAFAGIEHRDLRPGLDRVVALAARVGHRAAPELAHDLHAVVRWFAETVEPHLVWEEHWLYPEFDRLAGTPWATRLARFEHAALRELAARLDADGPLVLHQPSPDEAARLAGDLYALAASLRTHIQAEQEVLLPLLDEPAPAARPPVD